MIKFLLKAGLGAAAIGLGLDLLKHIEEGSKSSEGKAPEARPDVKPEAAPEESGE